MNYPTDLRKGNGIEKKMLWEKETKGSNTDPTR